jgi:hypothetical protein
VTFTFTDLISKFEIAESGVRMKMDLRKQNRYSQSWRIVNRQQMGIKLLF